MRTVEERFWAKVVKTEGCWIWTASTFKNGGHGAFNKGRRTVPAHRFAYELVHGPVANDILICHTCDNPWCVRPSHLFEGTHLDNMEDCQRKGRTAKGERNGYAKLTVFQVEIIRSIHEHVSWVTQSELARAFGVSQYCISQIVRGKSWLDGIAI